MTYRLPRCETRIRQMRGQGGAGYGGKKKHRGKGSRGGKGWAGSTKHRRSYIYKYALDHFGYKGFRPPTAVLTESVIINIGEVEKLAKGMKEIDLTTMGYTKLLGRGKLSKPLTITVASASASAVEAVTSAGGKLVLETIEKTPKKVKKYGSKEKNAHKEEQRSSGAGGIQDSALQVRKDASKSKASAVQAESESPLSKRSERGSVNNEE